MSRAYLGIRYADAPRLSSPVPAEAGPLGRFAASSLQPQGGYYTMPVPGLEVGDMAEDCLFLNVWTPDADSGDGSWPVLVWIHGGAFLTGGAASPTYAGGRLAAHGAVVVTINYRLGVLGFHRGNLGLQDMVCALEWVRDNIARYGGDPGSVTVFGQSAGASGIIHLLVAPMAQGLFRRAIIQSPGASRLALQAADEMADVVEEVLGSSPARGSASQVLAAQIEAARRVGGRLGPMPWHPAVGGEILPTEPLAAIRAGVVGPVDVLIGSTAAEMQLFVRPELSGFSRAELVEPVRHYLESVLRIGVDRDLIPPMFEPYEGIEGADLYVAVCTDQGIRVPILLVADALAAGRMVYSYSFDWDRSRTGASHTVDLPFVFGTVDLGCWERYWTAPTAAAVSVADTMMSTWVAFASAGDPSTAELGPWPRYDADGRATMHFGGSQHGVTEAPAARAAPLAPPGYPPV